MKNNIASAHILRLYIWNLLKNNEVLAEVNGKVPLNSEDDKTFAQSGKPYIIYGFSETTNRENSYMIDGNFAMRIITRDAATAVKIANVLNGAFEHGDVAATNVNIWSSVTSTSQINFLGTRFAHARVNYTNIGDEPAQEEDGRLQSIVMIEYKVFREYEVKTFDGVAWS